MVSIGPILLIILMDPMILDIILLTIVLATWVFIPLFVVITQLTDYICMVGAELGILRTLQYFPIWILGLMLLTIAISLHRWRP